MIQFLDNNNIDSLPHFPQPTQIHSTNSSNPQTSNFINDSGLRPAFNTIRRQHSASADDLPPSYEEAVAQSRRTPQRMVKFYSENNLYRQ